MLLNDQLYVNTAKKAEQSILKNIYMVSVLNFYLFRLPAKIGRGHNM